MAFRIRKGEHSGKIYYDRALRRILHFDHDVHPLRHYVADSNIFGLHVPGYPFYYPAQNNQLLERPRSRWMYRSKEPNRVDVGREYVASSVEPAVRYSPVDTEDEDFEDEGPEGVMEPQHTCRSPSPAHLRSPSYDSCHPGSRSGNRSVTRRRSRSRSREAHSENQHFRRERSPPRHWRPPPSGRSRSRSPTRRRFAAPDRHRPLQNRYSRQRRRSSSPSAGPSRL